MAQNPKNTVLAFLLIGITFIILGWVFELLTIEEVAIGVASETAESVLKAIREGRLISTILYGAGVFSVSVGGFRMMRLDTGE